MRKIEEILTILRSELQQGLYPIGTRFTSERKLMERFSSARLTINKVTEQLVSEGYLTRGQRGAGTYVNATSPFPLGHLAYVGPVASEYYAQIIHGCQQTAYMRGYALSVILPSQEQLTFGLKQLASSTYKGILVSGMGVLSGTYPLPLVYLDNSVPADYPPTASVTCDNYHGAFDMAEAVLSHGHRDILICTSQMPTEYSRQSRLRGFCDALSRHGIGDSDSRIIRVANEQLIAGNTFLQNQLRLHPHTTAILTDSDPLAFKLWLAQQHLAPKRPLCITGFGNLSVSNNLLPTVDQQPTSIGAQGVSMLIDQIEHPDQTPPQEIVLPTRLMNLDRIFNAD